MLWGMRGSNGFAAAVDDHLGKAVQPRNANCVRAKM